tara:strand:- start:131 stop:370 length:240 start_codon:yes stop_codon:yes gene_type:complete
MLGKIRNFIRKLSPNLSADSIRKAAETNPSLTFKGGQETDPSAFENTRISRIEFMHGDGRVTDDFNTTSKIDDFVIFCH